MNKEILKLAIPNIISNISIPLLSTVDTLLMGRLTPAHIGAVGIGSMIFNFIYWNFGFLRMGTTGITAQAYGEGNRTALSNTLGRTVFLGVVIALIILMIQGPLYTASAYLLNVQIGQDALVHTYFSYRMWAAPATLALYGIMGWLFGMQNAIYPMILTIFINAINIAVSWYFVAYMGMDADGVALGTVIAQYCGLLLAIILIGYKYQDYVQELKWKSIVKWNELLRFLKINSDLFIRTVCLTFAFGFFYSQSSKGGEVLLAANVLLLQFLNWMSYGVDGFAYASESLIGKYYGAKDDFRLMKAVRYSFVWGGVLAFLYGIGYYFGGVFLLQQFTDIQEVIEFTKPYLWWMAVFPLLSFASYIWDGVFIGLVASKALRNSMLLSMLVFVAVFFVSEGMPFMHRLWLTLLSLMVARGIIQTIMFVRKGKNLV